MFERFTERARQVVVLAQDEARSLRHNYIGTEHLLLGLLREEEGIAARALEACRVDLDSARVRVARIIGHGDALETGQIPFTPRATRVLELSLRNALRLGHNHVGTEHILLGLLEEGGGVALQVITDMGANPDEVWAAVHRQLGAASPPPRPEREGVDDLINIGYGPEIGDERWAWVYDWWPPMILGAGLFAGGLLVGWLIWA